MKYFEVTFTAQPCNETITDVLSGLTADIGFESFVECENGMKAYIQQSQFDEAALKQVVEDFPIPGTFYPDTDCQQRQNRNIPADLLGDLLLLSAFTENL